MSNTDFDEQVKGVIGIAIVIVFVIFISYYQEILSFSRIFSSNLWNNLTTIILWLILLIVGGIAVYFSVRLILGILLSFYNFMDYKITHRNDKERHKQRETEEIESLIETKQPTDQKELTNYIERVKEKIKTCKSLELDYFRPELKKRLANAIKLLEELEKEDIITSRQERKEQIDREIKASEERMKEKLRQEESRKWKIERELKINDYFEPQHIFYKDKLTEKEVQVLRENDFHQVNDYCIYEKKFCQVLVKKTLNHSVVHTFLVWGAKKLLEDIKEVKDIQEHNTRDADITFKFKGRIYALEIETGTLLAKENQLKGKVAYLNRKYPKRFMFIVSNRNFLGKYRKLGFSTPRNRVSENLRKLLGI